MRYGKRKQGVHSPLFQETGLPVAGCVLRDHPAVKPKRVPARRRISVRIRKVRKILGHEAGLSPDRPAKREGALRNGRHFSLLIPTISLNVAAARGENVANGGRKRREMYLA
jgi:hypothetical protein